MPVCSTFNTKLDGIAALVREPGVRHGDGSCAAIGGSVRSAYVITGRFADAPETPGTTTTRLLS